PIPEPLENTGKVTYVRVSHHDILLSPANCYLSNVEKDPVENSSLSSQIERAGTLLQNGAMDQIEGYRTRFEAVEGLYERLFQNIIRSEFNHMSAYETAKKFFGTDTVSFAAVDGTEYSRPLFDLVVFLGGSYASRGKIRFSPGIAPAVD